MSKLTTSIMIMSGMTLLFYLGGMLGLTASNSLLTMVLNPEGLQKFPLATEIIAVTGSVLILLTAVIGGARDNNFFLMVPLVLIFLSFAWDFVLVFQSMSAQGVMARIVGLLLFGPWMVMYVIGVVEWWRGMDG